MKLGNDRIIKKFDEIEEKVDFLINHCNTLRSENKELLLKIKDLEAELERQDEVGKQFSEHNQAVQTKVDSLLVKLNQFSDTAEFQNSSDL